MNVAIAYPEVYEIARFGKKRKEFPPFGMLYLAAVLEQAGFLVKFFKITSEKSSLDFREFNVVAFSINSSATFDLVKKARFASLYSPNSLIIAGGIHASFFPEKTLLDLQLDVVCIGEGEDVIVDIINYGKNKTHLLNVKGVCFLNNLAPYRTLPRQPIADLDQLPFPARHLLDREDFLMKNRLADTNLLLAHIIISRGCPFSCHFCATLRDVPRYRSGPNIRQELQFLIDNYGIEGFIIVGDNFVINNKKAGEICDSIHDLKLKWVALSRVDTVNDFILRKMKGAGCIEIKFGVETGSKQLLRSMNKGITRTDIISAIEKTYSAGIKVKIFLIHGFPGENLETTKETLDLLKRIGHMIYDVSLFRFVPLPGSYVHTNANEFNIRTEECRTDRNGDWSKYHIHHNTRHWWGDKLDFKIMNDAFAELNRFVGEKWPSKF